MIIQVIPEPGSDMNRPVDTRRGLGKIAQSIANTYRCEVFVMTPNAKESVGKASPSLPRMRRMTRSMRALRRASGK